MKKEMKKVANAYFWLMVSLLLLPIALLGFVGEVLSNVMEEGGLK